MVKARKTLSQIVPYSIDKYYTNWDLKLDSNENLFGPCPAVMNALKNLPAEKIKFYPAYGEAIEKLASKIGTKPENLMLTNGCDEAINVLLNAFLDSGEEVLSFAPTFSMPKLYCDAIGASFREISYTKKWQFDYDFYSKNISNNTKILYLTSPNNPTGDIVQADVIERLLKNYPDKLIVVDCTYLNYSSYDIKNYFELVSKYDNLAILKSFSKDYALAGLRVGYIYSNPDVISEIKKVISPYSVNAAAVCAVIAALDNRDYFKNIKAEINKSKEYLISNLTALGFRAYSTEANFILCDFGAKADFICNKLLNKNVKVKYFKNVKGLENTFRITIPPFLSAVKFIDLIKPSPLYVFDLDGVVFDVTNSYRLAIKKTFEHFSGQTVSDSDIQNVKNMGNMSNDWDVCQYLLNSRGIAVNYDEMVNVFQDLFYNPKNTPAGLIDNEKNVLDEEFFKSLTSFADCAVFTGRPIEEAFYSLEKFNLKKYFSCFICHENVINNPKPSPMGLNLIKEQCFYSDIYYFGDTVDDIKAGLDADVKVFGVIPPNVSNVDDTVNSLMKFGAFGIIKNKQEILKGEFLCSLSKK